MRQICWFVFTQWIFKKLLQSTEKMTKITTSWADVRYWVNRAGQRPCLVSFFGQNIEVPNDCAVCKKGIQSVYQQMPYLLVRRSLRDGEEYEQNITRSLYKKSNKSATTYKSDCMELFSSNANLTTPFPRPSTERQHSVALHSMGFFYTSKIQN